MKRSSSLRPSLLQEQYPCWQSHCAEQQALTVEADRALRRHQDIRRANGKASPSRGPRTTLVDCQFTASLGPPATALARQSTEVTSQPASTRYLQTLSRQNRYLHAVTFSGADIARADKQRERSASGAVIQNRCTSLFPHHGSFPRCLPACMNAQQRGRPGTIRVPTVALSSYLATYIEVAKASLYSAVCWGNSAVSTRETRNILRVRLEKRERLSNFASTYARDGYRVCKVCGRAPAELARDRIPVLGRKDSVPSIKRLTVAKAPAR